MKPHRPKGIALSVAGLDGSGGAGLLADVKVFQAMGSYGMGVASVLTVQNTKGLLASLPVDPATLTAQLEAIFSDSTVGAMKVGALGSAANVQVVLESVERYGVTNLVVDPVMKATLGARLLDVDAERLLRRLITRCLIVTANREELALLSGMDVTNLEEAMEASRRLGDQGAGYVLAKGGHMPDDSGEVVDLLWDHQSFHRFRAPRVPGTTPHGTGCVLSAAITGLLAQGVTVLDACEAARRYVQLRFSDMKSSGEGRPVLV